MLEEEVATLVDGMHVAGYKSVEWDASKMPTGVYMYRLDKGTFIETEKLTILR